MATALSFYPCHAICARSRSGEKEYESHCHCAVMWPVNLFIRLFLGSRGIPSLIRVFSRYLLVHDRDIGRDQADHESRLTCQDYERFFSQQCQCHRNGQGQGTTVVVNRLGGFDLQSGLDLDLSGCDRDIILHWQFAHVRECMRACVYVCLQCHRVVGGGGTGVCHHTGKVIRTWDSLNMS